jgi:hypothetical protein
MKPGKPVAEVVPVTTQRSSRWIDSLRGKLEITGDIISRVFDESGRLDTQNLLSSTLGLFSLNR